IAKWNWTIIRDTEQKSRERSSHPRVNFVKSLEELLVKSPIRIGMEEQENWV
ncbi:hypothetical protein U1Q18_005725, partial [Sarracenia purpurea var. burkii]